MQMHLNAPIDLVSMSLDEYVTVKCKSNRDITGRLHVKLELLIVPGF